jgi:hypothetical protein
MGCSPYQGLTGKRQDLANGLASEISQHSFRWDALDFWIS